jgi:tRNA (guanine-N7-)-methyltransferase|tara:strand:- start:9345 stop:9995 length:651 start_codon:yes stop_codon:yes gene_type:complete
LNKTIKSFSKARSRSSIKNKDLLNKANREIFQKEEDFKDFKFLIDESKINNLEIGFGDGKYLFEMACLRPEENFIGIEVFESGLANTYKKIVLNKIKNLSIIQGDIVQIIKKNESIEIFDQMYILFPDPWPKSKHKKRRLLKEKFLLKVNNLIKKNGTLIIKTDWQDYAEEIEINLKKMNFDFNINYLENLFKTKYEQIAINEDRTIVNFEVKIKS